MATIFEQLQAKLEEQARLSKADRKILDEKLEKLIEGMREEDEYKLLSSQATDNRP